LVGAGLLSAGVAQAQLFGPKATVTNPEGPSIDQARAVSSAKVPAFISEGEKIRVNTAEGTYQERA
jgi:hypothetical protein